MHLKKSHNEGSPVHEAPCLALALLTGSPEIATDKITYRRATLTFESKSRLEAENAAPTSAGRAAAQGAWARSLHERRSAVLHPAVSLVSVGAQGHHDHPA